MIFRVNSKGSKLVKNRRRDIDGIIAAFDF